MARLETHRLKAAQEHNPTITEMTTEGLSITVQLPVPGDEAFEALVQNVSNAVYERITQRLQDNAQSAPSPPDAT